MSPNQQSGYVLTKKKDMISVWSVDGAKEGNAAVQDALKRGAKTCDCFDGKLPGFYKRNGYREIGRMDWNPDYAPKGWDYKRYGKPQFVMLEVEKEPKFDIPKRIKNTTAGEIAKISKKV